MTGRRSGDAAGKTLKNIEDMIGVREEILNRLNADPTLALAAMANPLLALQELGFELSPELAQDIEERARFSLPRMARRKRLREEIRRIVGKSIDLNSEGAIRSAIASLVGAKEENLPSLRPRQPALGTKAQFAVEHPLEHLRDAHPIVPLVIEYQKVEQRAVGFAAPGVYQRIRSGTISSPVRRIRLRISERRPGS